MDEKVDATLDRLLVEFGKEILKIVPGKVSTEVDARFSFDMYGSIDKALHIIKVRWKLRFACTFASLIFLALQRPGHRQGASPYQARFDLGRHQSGSGPAEGARCQLQLDSDVLSSPGNRRCRSGCLPDLSLRWPYLGLVQSFNEEGLRAARRPWS